MNLHPRKCYSGSPLHLEALFLLRPLSLSPWERSCSAFALQELLMDPMHCGLVSNGAEISIFTWYFVFCFWGCQFSVPLQGTGWLALLKSVAFSCLVLCTFYYNGILNDPTAKSCMAGFVWQDFMGKTGRWKDQGQESRQRERGVGLALPA